jgi:regulator of protease activity HflC (stomatin/prohibitin superfamily)
LACDAKSLRSMTRLLSGERKAVALILRRQGLLRLAEVGVLLGVGEAQASRLVAEGEAVLRENSGLNRRLKRLTDDVGVE